MKEFYVYIWWRTDKELPEPFYVGKGKGKRYLNCHEYNSYYKNIVKLHKKLGIKPEVTFIYSGQSEEMVFYYEKLWIKFFGRKDLGLGTLVNLTDGGEGSSGFLHTEETKKKLSEVGKGKTPWNKGKEASEEAKKHQSEAHLGKSHPHEGVKKTEETKAKISASLIGNKRRSGTYTVKGHWKVTFPDGKETIIDNLSKFSRENGLRAKYLRKICNGQISQYKGYSCQKVT